MFPGRSASRCPKKSVGKSQGRLATSSQPRSAKRFLPSSAPPIRSLLRRRSVKLPNLLALPVDQAALEVLALRVDQEVQALPVALEVRGKDQMARGKKVAWEAWEIWEKNLAREVREQVAREVRKSV